MTPLPPDQPERRASASSEALATSDRLARLLQRVGIALAAYLALIGTVASVAGVWNSFRAVEEAKKGAGYAQDGASYAEQALRQAQTNETIAKRNENLAADVKNLVALQAPCDPAKPDSPACVRKAASDKVVADAIADIEERIDTHDVNSAAQHNALRARTLLPARTPITAAPRLSTTSTAPKSITRTPAPATTTTQPTIPPTTCPARGKSDNCKGAK